MDTILRRLFIMACALVLLGESPHADSKHDERDFVEYRERGKVKAVNGRVVDPFGPELGILVEGDMLRIPRADVVSVITVTDRLRAFLQLRNPGASAAQQWQLALDAERSGLPGIARLQAYSVLLIEPDHEGANEWLGHKRVGSRWKWKLGNKYFYRDDFEKRIADFGKAFELSSEHFSVRTDAGVRRAVELLFDLEALYVRWFEEFGNELLPREVLEPHMQIIARAEKEEMEGLVGGEAKRAWYDPGALGGNRFVYDNVIHTFFESEVGRASRLMELGTQQLIYTTLLREKTKGSPSGNTSVRHCATFEIGLGHWFGAHFQGAPGYAVWKDFEPLGADVLNSLSRMRSGKLSRTRSELTNLPLLTYPDFHQKSNEAPLYWSKARTFVAFLMDPNTRIIGRGGREQGTGREAVMRYMREVFGTPKASSSSALDDALFDTKVESLEGAWRTWLNSKRP